MKFKLQEKSKYRGFALILAALQMNKGQEAYINNVNIIERGYSNLINNFEKLGVNIEEVVL